MPVAVLGGACFADRDRPAPPQLELRPDRTTVHSPDQLGGTLRAADPDGIDSVWLTLDGREVGLDGLLRQVFETPFSMAVDPGHPAGAALVLRLRARDLAGFSDTVRTTVTVIP